MKNVQRHLPILIEEKIQIRIEVESELEYQRKKIKITTLILFCIIHQFFGFGSVKGSVREK